MLDFKYLFSSQVACKQAVLSALAAGQEKEGELATRSQEFEYLHQKSRCEMLIGGDDISNDVITLGTCFSMFVYIHVRFHFVLIGGNLTAQLRVATGNLRRNSNSRDVVSSSPSFSCPATRVSRRACSQPTSQGLNSSLSLRQAAYTFCLPCRAISSLS